MTAIAYKDGILAVDSQCSWNCIKTSTRKHYIVNVSNIGDCVVVIAGNVFATEHIIEWIKDHDHGRDTPFEGLQTNARYGFAITQDLIVYPIYGNGYVGMPDTNPFVAEGCAFEFLHGAMAQGASAAKAVELATQHVDGCSGPVITLNVKREIQKLTRIDFGEPF